MNIEQSKNKIYILDEKGNKPLNSNAIFYIINNECWEPINALLNNGYPRVGRKIGEDSFCRMNRYVYSLYNGKIPKKMVVRHKCDNKLCINPCHLETGTHKENMKDMVERGGTKKIIEFNKATKRKLNNKQLLEIKDLLLYYASIEYKNTRIDNILANKFNVSRHTIGNIRRGISTYSEFLGGGLSDWI